MSKQYDNTNRGVLFKNKDKQESRHPDYRGNINVGGQEFWLDAWIKESSKDGSKFMSLSIKPKEQRAAPQRATAPVVDDFNDDPPF